MAKRLITVKMATDKFNRLNRLNNRLRVGLLNQSHTKRYYNNMLHGMGMWREWKHEAEFYCNPCTPEIVKTRLFNRNPIDATFKKVLCKIFPIKPLK